MKNSPNLHIYSTRLFLIASCFVLFFSVSLFAFGVHAAPKTSKDIPSTPASSVENKDDSKKSRQEEALSMLQVLLDSMTRKSRTLRTLEGQLRMTVDENRRKDLQEQIAALQDDIEEQKDTFKSLAAGGRLDALQDSEEQTFTWNDQLKIILAPLLRELQNLTERPRQIDSLRTEIDQINQALPLLESALARIDKLIAETSDAKVRRELQDVRATWVERKTDLENNLQVARFGLEQIRNNERSLPQSISDLFGTFIKNRGKHLLIALITFFTVFMLLRWCKEFIFNRPKFKEIEKKNFLLRLFNITFIFIIFLFACFSALAVFYAAGDWLMLVISFVLVFSIVWSAKSGLMQYFEEIKLILNVGSVREGERIIYNGVPWLVERLHYYTRLNNPELSGGRLRVRLNQFIESSSRPFGHDEPWFPTRKGDWVLLADETFGKVVQQNPDMVRLMLFGGSFKTYPTSAFMDQNPVVLSTGFIVRSVFGVDYQNQNIATSTMVETFKANMEKALEAAGYMEHTTSITVDFYQAGASSLDIIFFGDFSGALADKYFTIPRMFQRVCVETCTREGWNIPFPQLTLHSAEAKPALPDNHNEEPDS